MMIAKYDTDKAFDYENGFYLTSKPYRMGNILAHYELYKKIIDLLIFCFIILQLLYS